MVFRKLLWSLTVENSFDREKSLFVENFLVYRKFPWSRKKFLCGNLPFLWKFYLMMVKVSFEKNFLVCWKFPWSQKNSCLLETFLFVGNFVDHGKGFVCRKLSYLWKISLMKNLCFRKFSWLRKNFCLGKTSLITERFLFLEKFLDCIKNNGSNNFETMKIYIFLSLEKKRNSLAFLR